MRVFIYLMLLIFSTSAYSLPKILVKHQRNADNLAEIQVINETLETLVCYVAIDGHKLHFELSARQPSQWYKATDTRFNFNHFSTWCDYLYLHQQG